MATEDDLAITLGVEEEFFLVDPNSRDLIADPDPAILEACAAAAGPHRVTTEFLRSQVETNTRVCASIAELRDALAETRSILVDAAERHGAWAMATSMHPFADWREQTPTARERYERFAITFQESFLRQVVGGMHVHAGFGTPDSRLRVMTALRRYLPALHALSASSPFNAGRETGFKSYRLTIQGALPRTSVPPPLFSEHDYEMLVDDYRALEFIGDGSELWWDLRPSARYPTVELRICDICTRLDDAVAIAALYAALIRKLLRQDAQGGLPAEPPTEIIAENRWLAARYGVLAFFGDVGGGGRVDIDDYLEALLDDVGEDARALGCEAEVAHLRDIVREGTSADRQLDLFRLRRVEGDGEEEALRAVVDAAVAETRP